MLTSLWKRFFSVLGMPSVPDRTFGKSGVSWCDNSARDVVVKGRGYGYAATTHPSGLPPANFCHELHFLGIPILVNSVWAWQSAVFATRFRGSLSCNMYCSDLE